MTVVHSRTKDIEQVDSFLKFLFKSLIVGGVSGGGEG